MKRSERLKKIDVLVSVSGLWVVTWNAGDGITRYRFTSIGLDYFENDGIFTALGIREAEAFAIGVRKGYEIAKKQMGGGISC